MNHQAKYKGASKASEKKALRVNNLRSHRQALKDQKWASERGINCEPNTPVEEPNSRKNQLKIWQTEKERKETTEAKRTEIKKPPFKVGVVRHRFYSPPIPIPSKNRTRNVPQKNTRTSQPPTRVTRATEKRLVAKNTASSTVRSKKSLKSFATENYQFVPPPIENIVLNPEPAETPITEHNSFNFGMSIDLMETPALDETYDKSSNESQNSSWCLQVTVDEENHDTKIANISTSSTIEIDLSPKTKPVSFTDAHKSSTPLPPAFYSPYIVSSRGKRNARKEQELRRGLRSINSNEVPMKETVMQNLNISVENEERTAKYFKYLLDQEGLRLTELCDDWTRTRFEETLPEDMEYLINQAIGQTQLLLNKKFQRFRGLVENCENGKGQMLITCSDLQGFWDMTKVEIKNCDQRFEKLEELRANNWEEPNEPDVDKSEEKQPVKQKVQKKKSKISAKPSGLRSFILAAKKKLMNQEASNEFEIDESNENQSTKSKKCSPKQTIQKSSRIRGEIISPHVVMKISRKYKTPEVQMDRSISYVNSHQTPGRGILKKNDESDHTIKKSSSKVNFHDDVSLNATLINKTLMDKELAIVLNKIDQCDLNTSGFNNDKTLDIKMGNYTPLKGKILEFDDNDSLENINADATFNNDLGINSRPQTPFPTNSDVTVSAEDTPMRVLRNRTINCLSLGTPSRRQSRKRHSFKEIDSKEAEIQTQVIENSESKENKTPNRKRMKSRASSIY